MVSAETNGIPKEFQRFLQARHSLDLRSSIQVHPRLFLAQKRWPMIFWGLDRYTQQLGESVQQGT